MTLRYVGRIQRARGVHGAFLLSDLMEDFRPLRVGANIKIGFSAEFGDHYVVEKCSPNGKRAVLKARGIDSPEAVKAFHEKGVFADADAFVESEEPAKLFDDEIVGCDVVDLANGTVIGQITEVWHMPANNVWAVDMDGKELPLPVIDDVIKKVDIEAKRVEVVLIPGLIDLAE